MIDRRALVDPLAATVRAAGAAILRVVEEGFAVEHKADDSPVTRADRAAEAVILAALRDLAPDVPVVAEEQVEAGHIPAHGDRYFLVDPLDGTKEFVRGGEDYTVNIGLIEDGVPTFGVIHVPVSGATYAGVLGAGAWVERAGERRAIAVRERSAKAMALTSKSHLTDETLRYVERACPEGHERLAIGSSLKFCLLAEGRADIYPRLSPTMEWDTAAGHAILLAAGGRIDGPDGAPLAYGKPRFFNPGFVATSGWQPPAIGALQRFDDAAG
ncbi:3'(2'),5'-bisphosphate nucleotidase CysQ [Sphingomicrobium sp. XHP0239]|uniref:3'(2'),5'-bisphosphate nucleotidase CysQ n=1 Tax=Sphingomicrobium maritimum TaxID=3133972 RepID=UPI0031CCBBD9